MNKIEYHIPEDSKNNLIGAIGSEIQLIYADRIIKEYQNPALEASYFILKLGKSKQIKIATSWFECTKTLDSYYNFEIENVDYSIGSTTSIFSFVNKDIISSISIANKSFTDDENIISHSFGIVIERNDSKRIIITGGESAFQNTILSDDEDYISIILKGAKLVRL